MSATDKPEAGLSANAKAWLEKLPDDTRPRVMIEEFPRLANRLSTLWRHPDELMEYIDELLVDTRGNRAGFPLAVAMELATLKDYYEQHVHPDRGKAYLWDPRRKNEEKG
jgi:hypothetical protein